MVHNTLMRKNSGLEKRKEKTRAAVGARTGVGVSAVSFWKKVRASNTLKIVIAFCIWRIALFGVAALPLLLSWWAPNMHFLEYRPDFAYTNLVYWRPAPFFQDNQWLTSWANFDGIQYLSIAGRGYHTEARFFPVFPLLIIAVSVVFHATQAFGPGQFLIGFVLSNFFFVWFLCAFYFLLRIDFSRRISLWSTFFALVFPTAFFFGSVYTESLFLLLTTIAFFSARKERWLVAGAAAMIASATRLVGILLFPALLIEFLHQEPILFHVRRLLPEEVADVIKRIAPIFLSPLGLIFFIWFNYAQWGRWLYFLQTQGEVGNSRTVNGLINPLQTLWRYVKILLALPRSQYEWWVAVLELVSFTVVVGLLITAWRMKKVRPSYQFFAWSCFLLPALSGTFTGLPRYVLIAFPIFLVSGAIKDRRLQMSVLLCSATLLFLLTSLFLRGYFVA
jgi:hypothetical protein